MRELLELLEKYGPWAIVVGEAWVIRFLFMDARERAREHQLKAQELNDRIISTVEKTTLLLQSSNDQIRTIVKAIGADRES